MPNVTYEQSLKRGFLRAAFHSLFWGVIVNRKRTRGLKMQEIADKLGVNKSFVSRSFSNPPNWRIDTISDFADALGLDLIVEARDRSTGRVFTASGVRETVSTRASMNIETKSSSTTTTDTPLTTFSTSSGAL